MVIGEWSLDGPTWNLGYVGPLEMSETVAYGLAITNHDDNDVLAEAEVSDVVLSDQVVSAAYRSIDGEPVYDPNDSRTVSITIGGQGTLTLQETPPAGWSINEISDGGTLADGVITWSLEAGTTVTYVATSGDDTSADAVFTGSTADYETYGEDTIVAPSPVKDFDNHMDIGAVGAAGSADYDEDYDAYTMYGSGADLWGTADEFHYLYKNISGAFMIEGNVFAYNDTSTNEWSKCGFMVREDLTAGSRNVISTIRPSDGQFITQWRYESNQDSDNSDLIANDIGDIRLVRPGSQFQSYYFDGTDWILDRDLSLMMNNDDKVGMALTSHDDGLLAYAEFTNVAITEY
ncbi:hypothetical protein K8I31_10410, partial [bacterium]|nr:hypothetical protein [bacterium]